MRLGDRIVDLSNPSMALRAIRNKEDDTVLTITHVQLRDVNQFISRVTQTRHLQSIHSLLKR